MRPEESASITEKGSFPSPIGLPAIQRRIIWGLLVGLVFFGTAWLLPEASDCEGIGGVPWSSSWDALHTGGTLAVMSLLAVWGALAPQPLVQRGPRTLGFALLFLLFLMWALIRSHFDSFDCVVAFPVRCFLLLAVQCGVLALLRWRRGWRLELVNVVNSEPPHVPLQFTVRQLCLWIAAAAGLLGLAKSLNLYWQGFLSDPGEHLMWLVPYLAVTLPTTVAGLGWMLGRSRRLQFFAATSLIVAVTSVVLLFRSDLSSYSWDLLLDEIQSDPDFLRENTLDLQVHLGFSVAVFGTLGIIRLCGYRLRRRSEGGSPFAWVPPPRRSAWRTPFPYLVTGLVLLGLAFGILGMRNELGRRVVEVWVRLANSGVKISLLNDRIESVEFTAGQAVPEAALRSLADLEFYYRGKRELERTTEPFRRPDRLAEFPLLSFSGSLLTDAQMQYLRDLPNLRKLNLAETPVSDTGLEALQGLTHLKELDLSGTRVTDVGLKHLESFTELRNLKLSRTAITDAGLRELASWPQLEDLDLTGTQVTDAGMSALASLPRLRHVNVGGPSVTAQAVESLKHILSPRCSVDYYQSADPLSHAKGPMNP